MQEWLLFDLKGFNKRFLNFLFFFTPRASLWPMRSKKCQKMLVLAIVIIDKNSGCPTLHFFGFESTLHSDKCQKKKIITAPSYLMRQNCLATHLLLGPFLKIILVDFKRSKIQQHDLEFILFLSQHYFRRTSSNYQKIIAWV